VADPIARGAAISFFKVLRDHARLPIWRFA
jgi:hypothetical protein